MSYPQNPSGGYVPFARQWYQDGIEVPEYYAQNLLGGSGVGGPFGLLENGARMSAQVTVATRGGRIVGTYADKQSIPQNNMAGIRQGELFAYYTHSNWSVGSLIELLQQDQDGKPKPKPRGTPTPRPTPTPKPYPNCYTFYQLIYENPDVQKFFKEIWADMRKSNAEEGGWLFFDEASYQIAFSRFTGAKPPQPGIAAEGPEDLIEQFDAAKGAIKKSGWSGRMALVIHTHPPGSGAERVSGGDWLNISHSAYLSFDGNRSLPFVGVIVYGDGKLTTYDRGGWADKEKLKRTCLKAKP
jgi:hypothetical protein